MIMATRYMSNAALLRSFRGIASQQPKSAVNRSAVAYFSTASATDAPSPPQAVVDLTRLPPVLKPPLQQALPAEAPQKGWLERLWSKYSLKGQRYRVLTAERLFQAATRQASDPRWFGPGRVGRDFRPRHALLTMHIWFLHKRLIGDLADRDTALLIQEELFNILWEDTTCRIRGEGVSELMVNKNLLQVQQYTFAHLTHYDHAFSPELLADPARRLAELRAIVWYHIFVRDEAAAEEVDLLNRIAWYIEANYQNIVMHWPEEQYRSAPGRVAWVDLPDFGNLLDGKGESLPENPLHPEDVLPPHWVRSVSLRGTEYYWNELTRETTWDRPVGN